MRGLWGKLAQRKAPRQPGFVWLISVTAAAFGTVGSSPGASGDCLGVSSAWFAVRENDFSFATGGEPDSPRERTAIFEISHHRPFRRDRRDRDRRRGQKKRTEEEDRRRGQKRTEEDRRGQKRTDLLLYPCNQIVLVRHASIKDRHTGGSWTVRRCVYKRGPNEESDSMTYLFSLEGDNPAADPILVHVEESDQLDARAEFICILPPAAS